MTPETSIKELALILQSIDRNCKVSIDKLGPRKPIFDLELRMSLDAIVQYLKDISIVQLKAFNEHDYFEIVTHHLMLAAHSIRTCIITLSIAKNSFYSCAQLTEIAYGAILHDIGKLCIPGEILMKPDRLSPSEYKIIKNHATFGYKILQSEIWLSHTIKSMVLKHHERLDGSGYPSGLNHKHLSYFDRIVSLADVFDAITSRRTYKEPKRFTDALEELSQLSPCQYDPVALKALSKCIYHKEEIHYAAVYE